MMLIDRINAYLLCALLALAPLAANASQNALSSPSTGTVSGLQLTNNYNNALDSVNTCNSGSTAPTNQLSGTPSLGNCWLNTTSSPYPVGYYDGSSGWRVPFWIDSVNGVTNVKIGGGVASVASASSVDLCGASIASRAYITITGTTTVNSFGSTCLAGHVKLITFAGILTLTYNATSMIIPGAANVTTAAGDQAVVVSLGSGNWQIVSYTPASGAALINPAIDVGDYLFTSAVNVPSSKYLLAYGQAISRTTYASYLAAVTIVQSVSSTNGSPTLTGFSDTTQIAAGAAVEASFLPNGTTVVSCTSTTCLLNNNATSSTTGNATIFPYGNGCGFGTSCASPSTNFNMPDCRDVVFAGRGNMGGTARSDSYQLTATYFGASPNALGVFGGGQSAAIAQANLPNVNFTVSGITLSNGALNFAGGASGGCNNAGGGCTGGAQDLYMVTTGASTQSVALTSNVSVSAQGSAASGGSGASFSRVPPTLTGNCMVRVLAQLDSEPAQHFAANDNPTVLPAIADRRRLAA